jgi:hypothetical protein
MGVGSSAPDEGASGFVPPVRVRPAATPLRSGSWITSGVLRWRERGVILVAGAGFEVCDMRGMSSTEL